MAVNQLVCIKRPEPALSTVFEYMYLNERLVDVTLSCCDGQLQAHRLVLAACSTYFSNLFDKLPNPFHYPVIIIKDVRIEDLKLIVEFMYRGQLTISQDRLINLIKIAENLGINGLSNVESIITSDVNQKEEAHNAIARVSHNQRKRGRKLTNQHNNHAITGRTYHTRQDDLESRLSSQPERMLEQSMITGESLDESHPSQFSYSNNDPTSARSLNHHLQTPSPSSMQLQLVPIEQQQQQQQQHQLNNQLQVLSHSLTANRSTMNHSTPNGQQQSMILTQQQSRGRVHSCNICGKIFREKANLKRHLQVHQQDRITYTCLECNKSFSWKDNYVRHTKTAHRMTTNFRPQAL